jgi:hypothetical protein
LNSNLQQTESEEILPRPRFEPGSLRKTTDTLANSVILELFYIFKIIPRVISKSTNLMIIDQKPN